MVDLDLLPKDIIIEVLSRLRAKSLLKFKRVCKTWYALIENPSFIDKHEKDGPSITSMLVKSYLEIYFRDDGFYKALDIKSHILSNGGDFEYFDIVAVCNGLFCAHFKVDYIQQGYIIGNPTTRDFRRIPFPKLLDMKNINHISGFSPIHDEYMIVQIMYHDSSIGSVDLKALGYNMNTDSWVEFDARVGHDYNIEDYLGWHDTYHEMLVFQKGVFYWGAGSYSHARVASFDISEGFYDEISIPAGILDTDKWRIIEFKEEISLITIHCDSRRLELWSLNEDTYSWTRRMRIDDIPIVGGPPGNFGGSEVVGYKTNGEILVRDTDNEGGDRVLLYDLNRREMEILPSFNIEIPTDLYLYTESLRSVHARDGAIEGGVLAKGS